MIRLCISLLLCVVGCASHPSSDDEPPPDATPEPDAPPPIAGPRRLVVVAGQSNAVGTASTKLITIRPEVADPYDAVSFRQWWHTGDKTDPLTWSVVPPGPLAPRDDGGVRKFSVELSLMRDLDAARPGQWVGAKVAVGGTSLYTHWKVDGGYPAAENLYHQMVDDIDATLADTGAILDTIVWIQGGEDALEPYSANAYAANVTDFIQALREHFGASWSGRFVFDKLSVRSSLPYQDIVRAQQAQVAADVPNVAMVDADDLDMPYPPHYGADSYVTLGDRFAVEILR
jgi:hypothetical protein